MFFGPHPVMLSPGSVFRDTLGNDQKIICAVRNFRQVIHWPDKNLSPSANSPASTNIFVRLNTQKIYHSQNLFQ